MPIRRSRSGWALLALLVVATSCGFRVTTLPPESTPPATTGHPVVTTPAPATTSHVTPPTSPPTTAPTTLAPLPPLSDFDVDITWLTDAPAGSTMRRALEDSLVMALQVGIDGPPEFSMVAFEDRARLEDAWVAITGGSEEEARSTWTQFDGQAYFSGRWHDGDLVAATYVIFVKIGSTARLGEVVTHEWFHLHQYAVTAARYWDVWSGSTGAAAAPEWLIEGAAEWFAVTALVAAGRPAPGAFEDWLAEAQFTSLATLAEDGSVRGADYHTCAAVVDVLVGVAGPTALLETYWATRLGSADPWEIVFTDVFGLTPEAFAVLVDTARARLR